MWEKNWWPKVNWWHKLSKTNSMISDLAFIHSDAKLGNNVTVDPFAYIGGDVVIGDDCWIGPNAVVMDGARLGKGCRVFPGAVVSAIPQDLKFNEENTTAEIGEYTTIRENATVNRGTVAAGKTIVGRHCLLMANSHVAHDCIVGDHCILVNNVALGGEVRMDDWAIMGGGSAAHQFCRIGAHTMISGGAMVRKDIPPYVLVNQEPVTYMGINRIGLERRGFTPEKVKEIHEIYRIIYQNKMNVSQALEHLRENFEKTPELEYIIDLISGSERGIIRSGVK